MYKGSLMRVWLTMDQNETIRTMEHKLLTTFTAQPDASVRKKKERKKPCSLIIWTFELLESLLQPTWILQSLIIQRWEAEL